MRKVTYNGDIKIIKKIVELLNRKVPTPLDSDGNAKWGTNGQMLVTDGTGSTNWVTPPAAQVQSDWNEADNTKADYIKNKPTIPAAQIQSDWTQADNTQADYIKNKPTIPTVNDGTLTIQQNGTTVGTFSANQSGDTTVNLTGGGGSGGHTIWNRIKTALHARANLWFADASVSDVSADDATKVEVVTELLNETAFDNLATDGTADGIYTFPDSGGEYLTAAMSSYDNTASGLSATDVQGAIDELAQNGGGINYSTTERVIGTWIDGSAVYEKTFVYEPAGSITDGDYDLCTVGADLLPVDIDVIFINSTTMKSYKMPYSTSTEKNNVWFQDGKVKLKIQQDAWGAAYKVYITVKYIKTA